MIQSDAEWIVIADGERARFLTRAAPAAFQTIKVVQAGTPSVASIAWQAGARQTGAWQAGSPSDATHQQAHDRFAALVAAHLNAAAGAGLFGRLVLAAPTGILHALEADLDHPALSRITFRIPRDLTQVPDGELVPHLPPWPGGH